MAEPTVHLPSVSFGRGADIWRLEPGEYEKLEAGFKRLSKRSLLMAGIDDVVIVDSPVSGEYIDRLRALNAGGARRMVPSFSGGSCLSEDVAASPELVDFLRKWDGAIEVYMPSRAEEALAEKVGRPICAVSPDVVELLNDKMFFLRLIEDLGAPMIETFAGNSDAMAERIRRLGAKPVIIRSSNSVGGSGVWVIRDAAERAKALADMDKMGRDRLFLLQPLVDTLISPNLQFYVGPERVRLFAETAQVMTPALEHTGNMFDRIDDAETRDELIRQGSALALEAASLGYRGVMGVDFVVTRENKVYAVEINARHNTSTHAAWFLNRFYSGGDPYAMIEPGKAAYLRLDSRRDLRAMEWIELLGDDVFDPDSGAGVMPYDTGGEFCAVIAGRDTEERRRLIGRVRSLCGAPGGMRAAGG